MRLRRLRYVALGYVFGFWASILFSGHYKAVLESTKPKLFIQARAGRGRARSCARGRVQALPAMRELAR